MESLRALFLDHWLWRYGDSTDERGCAIRAKNWEIHHPCDPEWRRAVWDRSLQVMRQALEGISRV